MNEIVPKLANVSKFIRPTYHKEYDEDLFSNIEEVD